MVTAATDEHAAGRPQSWWMDVVVLALIVLLAAPWLHQARLPLVGVLRDDACYATYALALARGDGYVDLSQPGHPPAERYPPGFSLALAPALTGATSVRERLPLLSWWPPIAGGLFLALTFGYLRFQQGWSRGAAIALAAVVACFAELHVLAETLYSDLAFACWALLAVWGAEWAGRRSPLRHRHWVMVGLASACAWLTRYAGVALVAAVALALVLRKQYRQLAVYLGVQATVLLSWGLYRVHAGGDYLTNYQAFMDGGVSLLQRLAQALQYLLGGTLPPYVLPVGNLGVLFGVIVVALAVAGGYRDWRAPGLPVASLYVALSALLALGYSLGFLWYGNELLDRLLLPVAPLLYVLLASGLGGLVEQSGSSRPRPVLAGYAWAAAMILAGVWRQGAPPSWLASPILAPAVVPDVNACMAFVRTQTAPSAHFLSAEQKLVYVYADREGFDLPIDTDNRGFPAPLAPLGLLMTLEHYHADGVVVLPPVDAFDFSSRTVQAFLKAYPAVLAPLWHNAPGTCAVYGIQRGPYEAAVARDHVREQVRAFEAQERQGR